MFRCCELIGRRVSFTRSASNRRHPNPRRVDGSPLADSNRPVGAIWGNKKPGTAPTDAKCAQVAASKSAGHTMWPGCRQPAAVRSPRELGRAVSVAVRGVAPETLVPKFAMQSAHRHL